MEIPLFAGLFAAVLHIISGPDHLAAVTPFALESRRRAWKVGFSWGFGHLIAMLLIAGAYLLFKDLVPIADLSQQSEQMVAWVLIGVGIWVLYRLFYSQKTGEKPEKAPLFAVKNAVEQTKGEANTLRKQLIPAFGIGLLHGLAGIAHFLLLLPALGFEKTAQSIQYILGFAFGTLLTMSVYTFLLGKVRQKSAEKPRLLKKIRLAGGLFSFVVGFFWLFIAYA